jgi:hypothetical protein
MNRYCLLPCPCRKIWLTEALGSGKWATTVTESAGVSGLSFAIALGAIATKSNRSASVYPTNLRVMILFIIGLAQNALTGDNGLFDLLFLLCKAIHERARIDSTSMEYWQGHATSHQVIDDYSGSL